eukprot:GHVN01022459.1.p1 GENE.GHVN01022459.1~~GHVN01022459.1.p1  ORF type:complete len:126 (-),score=5.48 GHVN01022459.1:571-948(-)
MKHHAMVKTVWRGEGFADMNMNLIFSANRNFRIAVLVFWSPLTRLSNRYSSPRRFQFSNVAFTRLTHRSVFRHSMLCNHAVCHQHSERSERLDAQAMYRYIRCNTHRQLSAETMVQRYTAVGKVN